MSTHKNIRAFSEMPAQASIIRYIPSISLSLGRKLSGASVAGGVAANSVEFPVVSRSNNPSRGDTTE